MVKKYELRWTANITETVRVYDEKLRMLQTTRLFLVYTLMSSTRDNSEMLKCSV